MRLGIRKGVKGTVRLPKILVLTWWPSWTRRRLPRQCARTAAASLQLRHCNCRASPSWRRSLARPPAALHSARAAATWAPEFGGRKWVLRVRDWPSQNGVFGVWLKRHGIYSPHFNRKNELVERTSSLFSGGGRPILLCCENKFCCEPRAQPHRVLQQDHGLARGLER